MSDDSHKMNGDANDVAQKEALSLKRGREASLEPSIPEAQQTPPSTLLKKNRLEQARSDSRTSPIPEGDDAPLFKASDKKVTVNEVRRKVEKMSHAEGEEGSAKDLDVDVEGAETSEVPGKEKDLKRKALERGESSTVIGESEAKRPKDSPPPAADTTAPATSIPDPTSDPTPTLPAKKPQATFGAFSSAASPFSKPSSSSSASSSALGPSSTPAAKPFSSSGFGGFSGSSSPFAAKKTSAFGSAAASSSASTSSKLKELSNGEKESEGDAKGESEETDDAEKGKQGNFGDILSGAGENEEVKDKPQMTEMDVVTGEEDESTKFQMRTKLYVMQSDNSWRERGVGVLRLNVRRGDGQGARLVMRAEGVLRLILNVSLYVGQTCMEDGKHVRTTVFEDGERRFVTFRTGSAKAAQELAGHIQEFIPLESSKSAKSPQPTSQAKEPESDGPTGRW